MLDFSIVGVPKAGTSSLYSWLEIHPATQGSDPKETFALIDDDNPLKANCPVSRADTGDLSPFFPEPQAGRLRFEATTHHLYQHTARDFLTALRPQPLILVLLREPAARMLSAFRFTQNNRLKVDPNLSFDRYVDALLAGNLASLQTRYRDATSYWVAQRELDYSCYAHWLEWWADQLEPTRLYIVLFEELRINPLKVVTALSERLAIDPTPYHEFPFQPQNQTQALRLGQLHRWVAPLAARIPAHPAKRLFKKMYLRLQQQAAPQPTHYESGLRALRDYFGEWNQRLEKRFSLNLDKWRGGDL